MEIIHGDIIYSRSWDALCILEDSYILVENGVVSQIISQLPQTYKDHPVTDYGKGLIIPAFTDLHIHAPQFHQRGTGMDLLLSDWLNRYTFPQEAKFASADYARQVYPLLVRDMLKNGTFHASVFGTIHPESTGILLETMLSSGMYGYVGKVNMDCNAPDYLCETTEQSLRDTEEFLHRYCGETRVRPILTPRFAPTCTEALVHGLGKLAAKYHCGLQTHLVESRWEAAEALRLYPGYHSDAEIYERAGLMDNGPSIFAHVIFPSEEDIATVKRHNGFAVHCPEATVNVIAGIMPTASLQNRNMAVCIGSDVGAGNHCAVYRQIARAVQLSKLKQFYEPEGNITVTFENAFCMATKTGGEAFGRVGSLEPGYHFNALVIDGIEDPGLPLPPEKRLERFCYSGDDRNIVARYIEGKSITV